MPTDRTALLAALMLVFCLSAPAHAQSDEVADPPPIDQAEDVQGQPGDAALDHIERLEQMLRDAGLQPPARPDTLTDVPEADVSEAEAEFMNTVEPILPPSFATVVFETESEAINARGDKAANAIKHVRRWLERDDVKRKVAAQDIVKTLTAWADQELALIQTTDDAVLAYIHADDAIRLLGQDPLAMPFKRYVMGLQRDRSAFRDLESLAAYRRAMDQAQAVGLLDDWALIDFTNVDVRSTIRAIAAKLTLITNHWPNSEGASAAQAKLDDWAAREAQAVADLPAWRYTWQMSLIQVGTETKTKVITRADGSVYIEDETDIVYDKNNIVLYGTFQNTSDKPYRYTFLAAVAPGGFLQVPFNKLAKNQLSGFELVQTPMLAPGELCSWEVTVSVGNIHNLTRGGVTMVEVHEREARR